MVADRQGSEHQSGMNRFLAPCINLLLSGHSVMLFLVHAFN
jgi:hypothetical protein